MLDIDFTFLWTALNLLILYFFMKKFLFGRVGKFMQDRADKIKNDMEKAERLSVECEALKAEQEKLRDSAAEERKTTIQDAQVKAQRDADAIIADAKKQAAALITAAHEEIAREHERAIKELRNEVASLAIAAASKVVEANMDTQKNRELIDELLDKEGVA